MEIFELLEKHEHDQVVFWSEKSIGYRGIIAIHDTTLGPALGGTRFWNYKTDEAAVIDALRLSRGMTYKAAVTGLDLGGGKSVIIGDNRTTDREAIFRAHGRAVESLGGRYITAEDVGVGVEDMEYVHMETEHCVGLLGRSGDPSPVTAFGVFRGIKACAHEHYGDDALDGKHITVQGLGHVGYNLCSLLHGDGARLTVTDIDPSRVKTVVEDFGAASVEPDAIYAVDADVFAPCALGAVVNDETLAVLSVDIIGGAANNQLARSRHGAELTARGILYAPDYVINAGGLCNVYGELHDWSPERSRAKAGEIYGTLLRIFETAKEDGVPTSEAADRVAKRHIEASRQLQESQV